MKVFISYRRNDERHAAARVYERLVHDLGKDNVFLDVDSLRYGADFVNVIGNTIAACEWCLVVISKNWRGPSATGTARIDDEADFVRIEIETALRSPKTTVIPVLVGDTAMPQPSD